MNKCLQKIIGDNFYIQPSCWYPIRILNIVYIGDEKANSETSVSNMSPTTSVTNIVAQIIRTYFIIDPIQWILTVFISLCFSGFKIKRNR